MQRRILLVLSFCAPLFLSAQQLSITVYSSRDHLPFSEVNAIGQDEKGFIWIAAGNVVYRYDGTAFNKIPVLQGKFSSYVSKIRTVNGQTYFITTDGLMQLRQDSIRYTLSLPGKEPADILYTGQQNWVLCKDGLYQVSAQGDARLFIPYLFGTGSNQIQDLFEWKGAQLITYNVNASLVVFDIPNRTVSDTALPVLCMFRNADRRICFLERGKGINTISTIDSKRKIPSFFLTASYPFPAIKNLSAVAGANGNVWVNINRQGVLKISPVSGARLYTREDGFPDSWFSRLFIDREQNIWAGQTNFLIKIREPHIQRFGITDGLLSESVSSVCYNPADSAVWVAGAAGLNCMYKNKVYTIKKFPFTRNNEVVKLIRFNGNILMVKGKDILEFKRKPAEQAWTEFKWEGSSSLIADLCLWNDENIILANAEGISVKNARGQTYLLDTIQSIRLTEMISGEHLLAATLSEGFALYRLTKEGGYVKAKQVKYSLALPDSIPPPGNIRSVYSDKQSRIWIGTRTNGLYCFKLEGEQFIFLNYLGRSGGFDNPLIWEIAETGLGKIIISTSRGLYEIKQGDKGLRAEPSALMDEMPYMIGVEEDFMNRLWVVSSPGIICIPPTADTSRYQYATYINRYRVGNQTSYSIDEHSGRRFSYKDNSVEVSFSTHYFINEKKVWYTYRLGGSGANNWSAPSQSSSAFLYGLNPGSYQFEVKALLPGGLESTPARLAFVITPPFWKTNWFYAITVISLLLAGYIAYRIKIKRLQAEMMLRNRIARDLHDDVGSTLSGINLYSKLALKKLTTEQTEVKHILNRIETNTSQMMENMSDIVWSINPGNDTLGDMLVRMKEYTAEMLEAKEIAYRFEADERISLQKINPDNKREIYLLFKEAINNIAKHAGAGEVWVKIAVKQQQLQMVVQDDGVGIKEEAVTRGNGLRNMKQRAEKLGGRVLVEGSKGQGTIVHCFIPLT